MMCRWIALAAVLFTALLQTGCTLAPTALGIARLLVRNDAAVPAGPVWQMEPAIPETPAPALPDLRAADPRATVASAR
jgi:hypothetical protein